MPSLRERVFNVARALANFDSCASWPFTAATILSRWTIARAASMMFMATYTYSRLIQEVTPLTYPGHYTPALFPHKFFLFCFHLCRLVAGNLHVADELAPSGRHEVTAEATSGSLEVQHQSSPSNWSSPLTK